MDARFLPAFENQARELLEDRPFRPILAMITSMEREMECKLRADGLVFLLINVGYMIILPWERTEVRSFLEANGDLLRADIGKILSRAKDSDSYGTAQEISANRVLEAVNELKADMSTLNLRLWGTDARQR